MLNSFEISPSANENYTYSYQFNDDLTLNYQHEEIFNIASSEKASIACYGYCFDVRNPQNMTADTLNDLIDTGDLHGDIRYLNGHFILIYKTAREWKLLTDAVSITPLYIDEEHRKVTTSPNSGNETFLNSSIELNLNDYSGERLERPKHKLTDERIERIILDSVKDQYKYFEDKDLTLNFRRNKMNKSLISILHPVLRGKELNLREKDDLSYKVGKWLERDYKMDLLDQEEEPSTDYICNVHLMDYQAYRNKETGLDEDNLNNYRREWLFDDEETNEQATVEYNLQTRLNYHWEDKPQLIYDPFNVRIIQEWIYRYDNVKTFDPLNRIIKILHPTIDFYDFASGMTLAQKYDKLLANNKKIKEEAKNSIKNFEFIQKAKEEGIILSNNLDGQLEETGVTVYPASVEISKDDIYEVEYTKKGHGLVLVETFFDNPKNAHRIKIELNGELFNIDEFLQGKFINVESTLSLRMYYERDYSAVSWQKAGRIKIKEIS